MTGPSILELTPENGYMFTIARDIEIHLTLITGESFLKKGLVLKCSAGNDHLNEVKKFLKMQK